MSEMRDLTPSEAVWFRTFKQLLKEQPRTVEVIITGGSAMLLDKGAAAKMSESGYASEDYFDSCPSRLIPFAELN
jgi:hypothetical protein